MSSLCMGQAIEKGKQGSSSMKRDTHSNAFPEPKSKKAKTAGVSSSDLPSTYEESASLKLDCAGSVDTWGVDIGEIENTDPKSDIEDSHVQLPENDGWELEKIFSDDEEADNEGTENFTPKIMENDHSGMAQTNPAKRKRERYDDDDAKESSCAPSKKLNTESAISEEEIRAVCKEGRAILVEDIVNHYPGRLKSDEEQKALIARLRNMSSNRLYVRDRKTKKPVEILY